MPERMAGLSDWALDCVAERLGTTSNVATARRLRAVFIVSPIAWVTTACAYRTCEAWERLLEPVCLQTTPLSVAHPFGGSHVSATARYPLRRDPAGRLLGPRFHRHRQHPDGCRHHANERRE